jgi:2-aminobenzoate-CoA ligase
MQADRFVHDHMPPATEWPVFVNMDDRISGSDAFNLVEQLLGGAMQAAWADRPLFRSESDTLTYREALALVNQRAHVLTQTFGLQPGNRVLIRGGNSIGCALAWLAVVKAGLVAVATMPLLRAKELGDILAVSQPVLALCDAALLDELLLAQAQHTALTQIVSFNAAAHAQSFESLSATQPTGNTPVFTQADDMAVLAFTSGTTGPPKAACHSHLNIWSACHAWPRHVLQARSDDIVMGTPPLAFTFGLGGLLLFPMVAGASVFFPQSPLNAERMVGLMAESGCTVCYSAPTFYRQMAPFVQHTPLPKLRLCVSAGEALPDATRDLWRTHTGIELLDGIGATEMFHIFISSPAWAFKSGSLGKVVPGYEACVMDAHGNELPRGQAGQLAVRGPTGCRYLSDKRQANYVQWGWNFPGDTVSQDEDGYFFYHARSDDMIVSSGYNISGPEVEGALLSHPAIAECAVIGKPDQSRGMVVQAFCVLSSGHAASADMVKSLQDHVKQQLAPYKYPRDMVFVDSLPRTPTGKLQRFKLRPSFSSQGSLMHTVLCPPDWLPPKGYANGIMAKGQQIFVGGQIGWNAQQQFESDDFIEQTAQALRNVMAVLACAGASPQHMVRMTWYITDRQLYVSNLKALGGVYRDTIGKHFPAMTCVVVNGLIEPRALVEIEVTAVMPDAL